MNDDFLKWLEEENRKLWADMMKKKLDSMSLHPKKYDPAVELTLQAFKRPSLAN
jgi:hypothetical protein